MEPGQSTDAIRTHFTTTTIGKTGVQVLSYSVWFKGGNDGVSSTTHGKIHELGETPTKANDTSNEPIKMTGVMKQK